MLNRTSLWALGALFVTSQAISAQEPRPRAMVINTAAVSGQSYIGVGLGEIDSDRARQLKLKEEHGVELTHVEEESPAAKAGLKSSDVVLEYNGQRVEGMEQFARFVRETPPGREAKLTISRDGTRQMMIVKIGQRKGAGAWSMTAPMAPMPPMPPNTPGEMPRTLMIYASPRMGIDAEAIDGQLGQFFGVKEGVLIRAVSKNSAAEKAGLRAGDVITKVDNGAVASPSDVSRAIRAARAKKTFPVTVMREKRETNLNLTIEDNNNEDRSERKMFFFHDGDGGPDFAPGSYQFRLNDGDMPMHFEFPSGSYRVRTIQN